MPKRHARRLLLLVPCAVVLLAGPAAAAPALEFGGVGVHVAGGAGGVVMALVACDQGAPGAMQARNLFVQLRQAAGDGVASGSGFTEDIVCDGGVHEVQLAFIADPGSRPFRSGEALVQGSLSVCSVDPGAGPFPA
ncbi:MAG: hypothetical protein ACRDKW_05075, partial [Actinomycetota bacterium]